MDIETKNHYVGFHYNMSTAFCEVDNYDFRKRGSRGRELVNKAKFYYFELIDDGVYDIEHLKGCLNTLEKELGMEVTQ